MLPAINFKITREYALKRSRRLRHSTKVLRIKQVWTLLIVKLSRVKKHKKLLHTHMFQFCEWQYTKKHINEWKYSIRMMGILLVLLQIKNTNHYHQKTFFKNLAKFLQNRGTFWWVFHLLYEEKKIRWKIWVKRADTFHRMFLKDWTCAREEKIMRIVCIRKRRIIRYSETTYKERYFIVLEEILLNYINLQSF